jgi:hypothetical protein
MILLARERGWHMSEERAPVQAATPAPVPEHAKVRERNLAWFARWRRRSPSPVEGG